MASNMYANSTFTSGKPASPPPPQMPQPPSQFAPRGARDPRVARGYRPPNPSALPPGPPPRQQFRPASMQQPPSRTPMWQAQRPPPAQRPPQALRPAQAQPQTQQPPPPNFGANFSPTHPMYAAFMEGTRMAALVTAGTMAVNQAAQMGNPAAVAVNPPVNTQPPPADMQCASCRSLRSGAGLTPTKKDPNTSEDEDDDLSDLPEAIKVKVEKYKEESESFNRQNQELKKTHAEFKKRIEAMADLLKRRELRIKELEEKPIQQPKDMDLLIEAEQRASRKCRSLETQLLTLSESSKEMNELYIAETQKSTGQQSKIDSLEACLRRVKAELQEKSLRIHFLQNLVKTPALAPAPVPSASEPGHSPSASELAPNSTTNPLATPFTPESDHTNNDLPEDFLEDVVASAAGGPDPGPMLSNMAHEPESSDAVVVDENDSADSVDSLAEQLQELPGDDESDSAEPDVVIIEDSPLVVSPPPKPTSDYDEVVVGLKQLNERLGVLVGEGYSAAAVTSEDESPSDVGPLPSTSNQVPSTSSGDEIQNVDQIADPIGHTIADMDATAELDIRENLFLQHLPSADSVSATVGNSVYLDRDIKCVGRLQPKYVGIHQYRKRPAGFVGKPSAVVEVLEKLPCPEVQSTSGSALVTPVTKRPRSLPRKTDIPNLISPASPSNVTDGLPGMNHAQVPASRPESVIRTIGTPHISRPVSVAGKDGLPPATSRPGSGMLEVLIQVTDIMKSPPKSYSPQVIDID